MSLEPLIKTFVTVTFLTLLASARADDANWSNFGSAGAFTPNKHVRMEHEDVRLSLDDEVVHVHATFWFRNQGPATTVWMGFPDETIDNGKLTQTPIRNFRSTVDGQRVKVRHQKFKSLPDDESGCNNYRSAWVKTVRFGKDGDRKVEVWYDAAHGFAGSGWALDTYVFKSGATWRGTIGRIETTVDWTNLKSRSRPTLKLTGPAPGARWTSVGYRKEKLVVENVKPKFDLDLTTIDGFWNLRLNGKTLDQRYGCDDTGSSLSGSPEDLLIRADKLGSVFEEEYVSYRADDTRWKNPAAKKFGGKLSLLGNSTLVASDGRKFLLKRPATTEDGKPVKGDDAAYVRLKDVFRALGGHYRFVRGQERVDLRL